MDLYLDQMIVLRKKQKKISELTKDVSEYLSESLNLKFKNKEKKLRIAYHSACSMQHGQKVHNQPINLLAKTKNEILEIPEGHICCGSAGTYNILQSKIAKQLLQNKVKNIESLNPHVISTGNIGCITQIANGTNIPILHTVELLDWYTGGPEPKEFFSVTEEDWNHYHNQLFLGFCLLLQKIKVNDGGYIFLISSNVIKEPNPKLIISSAYRSAFSSVFKILSKEFASKQISCINIAPGPINTDRTKELIDDVEAFAKTLPMKRLGKPEEIGNFVKSIVEHDIKYLSGAVINFDGANSNFVY